MTARSAEGCETQRGEEGMRGVEHSKAVSTAWLAKEKELIALRTVLQGEEKGTNTFFLNISGIEKSLCLHTTVGTRRRF